MFGSALGLERFKPSIEMGHGVPQRSTSSWFRISCYCSTVTVLLLFRLACFHDGNSTSASVFSVVVFYMFVIQQYIIDHEKNPCPSDNGFKLALVMRSLLQTIF